MIKALLVLFAALAVAVAALWRHTYHRARPARLETDTLLDSGGDYTAVLAARKGRGR